MNPIKTESLTETERLIQENEAMKADIRLLAVTIRELLINLGMTEPDGSIRVSTRSVGKLLPKIISGELNEHLAGLSALAPLFEKYKHLADHRPRTPDPDGYRDYREDDGRTLSGVEVPATEQFGK